MKQDRVKASADLNRREALGLFKAVATLGAGLMVAEAAYAQTEDGLALESGYPSGEMGLFQSKFFVISNKKPIGSEARQEVFTVELPASMVKLLAANPDASVQAKFYRRASRGSATAFATGQYKIDLAVVQSKDFQESVLRLDSADK